MEKQENIGADAYEIKKQKDYGRVGVYNACLYDNGMQAGENFG